jgi:hypothetical protein
LAQARGCVPRRPAARVSTQRWCGMGKKAGARTRRQPQPRQLGTRQVARAGALAGPVPPGEPSRSAALTPDQLHGPASAGTVDILKKCFCPRLSSPFIIFVAMSSRPVCGLKTAISKYIFITCSARTMHHPRQPRNGGTIKRTRSTAQSLMVSDVATSSLTLGLEKNTEVAFRGVHYVANGLITTTLPLIAMYD